VSARLSLCSSTGQVVSGRREGMARRVERIVSRTALTKYLYLRYHERRFTSALGSDRRFRGVYADFASAAAAAPRTKPLGYDNEATAALLTEERYRIHDSDFPILFWLSRLLREDSRIFDLGGNVGLSFYAYRPYLPLPKGCQWLVYDVPAVVRAGRAILAADPAPQLSFTSSYEALQGAEILLAAGSLQYVEEPLHFLRSTTPLPTHVLLNKMPIYEQPSALTIQATGASFCPYHLFNRCELLNAFAAHGYELVHSWQNPTLGCHIPTFPEHSIEAYSGFYLRRAPN
jgi:putative methyltransferase (TIGR04325 family)